LHGDLVHLLSSATAVRLDDNGEEWPHLERLRLRRRHRERPDDRARLLGRRARIGLDRGNELNVIVPPNILPAERPRSIERDHLTRDQLLLHETD
jgi:hypothetical protein